MRYCLCLCGHILSLVHVVSLDICEVKIVAQACIQKISEKKKWYDEPLSTKDTYKR